MEYGKLKIKMSVVKQRVTVYVLVQRWKDIFLLCPHRERLFPSSSHADTNPIQEGITFRT